MGFKKMGRSLDFADFALSSSLEAKKRPDQGDVAVFVTVKEKIVITYFDKPRREHMQQKRRINSSALSVIYRLRFSSLLSL